MKVGAIPDSAHLCEGSSNKGTEHGGSMEQMHGVWISGVDFRFRKCSKISGFGIRYVGLSQTTRAVAIFLQELFNNCPTRSKTLSKSFSATENC